MIVTIRGKRWNLRFCRMVDFGRCDPPTTKKKEIRIRQNLSPQVELDTLIHECLHAAHWDLDENSVDQTATDLSRILWRLGWRKTSS